MAQTGEYHRGQMPVAGQQATYTLFNALVHWCSAAIAALLAFLTIWLCAHGGFLTGLIVAVVIMAVAFVMNRRPGHH